MLVEPASGSEGELIVTVGSLVTFESSRIPPVGEAAIWAGTQHRFFLFCLG